MTQKDFNIGMDKLVGTFDPFRWNPEEVAAVGSSRLCVSRGNVSAKQ